MKIFISHKLEDSNTANQIAQALISMKVDCYLDILDASVIDNGEALTNHIRANLNKCTDIIVVMSSITRYSQWVPFEVGMAAQKDMPTVTFLKENVELPEYLQYWPRLKQVADIPKYVATRLEVDHSFAKSVLYESAEMQQHRKTEAFYKRLKKIL